MFLGNNRHVWGFDQLSLLNKPGDTSLPFPVDKHLSFSLHLPINSSSFFSSSTHHPLSQCFYGWVVIFPWDSGGGELSRACCFIPNNARNMFRPPCLGFTNEALTQKLIFLLPFHPCTHIPCIYSVNIIYYTYSTSLWLFWCPPVSCAIC